VKKDQEKKGKKEKQIHRVFYGIENATHNTFAKQS
jgi:hypothetical protein